MSWAVVVLMKFSECVLMVFLSGFVIHSKSYTSFLITIYIQLFNTYIIFFIFVYVQGQKPAESDESSSWGSDTDIPLSIDDGPANPTPRGTPSNKILSVISDAELRRMAILRPASGGSYSGRSLRNTIATIQKQIDKQDPGEEYKVRPWMKFVHIKVAYIDEVASDVGAPQWVLSTCHAVCARIKFNSGPCF